MSGQADLLFGAESAFSAPDMVVRYDYSPKWGNLMAAAIVRYFVAESTLTDARATKWVAGGTLSGWANIPTKNGDRLKWNFLIGPGVSGLMLPARMLAKSVRDFVSAPREPILTSPRCDFRPAPHGNIVTASCSPTISQTSTLSPVQYATQTSRC